MTFAYNFIIICQNLNYFLDSYWAQWGGLGGESWTATIQVSGYKIVLQLYTISRIYIFSSDLSQMVLIEPVELKGKGKYAHIVHGLVSGSNNIPLTTITHGPREVVKILAWDTTNDLM